MKTLSLTQPWAQLVVLGKKTIETRGWSTSHRGTVLIHSSKAFPSWAKDVCLARTFWEALGWNATDDWDYKRRTTLPCGYILGTVDIIGCDRTELVRETLKEPELSFGDYSDYRYAWLLDKPRMLREPVSAKGSLGLWNWELPAEVRKELGL